MASFSRSYRSAQVRPSRWSRRTVLRFANFVAVISTPSSAWQAVRELADGPLRKGAYVLGAIGLLWAGMHLLPGTPDEADSSGGEELATRRADAPTRGHSAAATEKGAAARRSSTPEKQEAPSKQESDAARRDSGREEASAQEASAQKKVSTQKKGSKETDALEADKRGEGSSSKAAGREASGNSLPARASSEAGIEIFTWGNVAALLVLVGGCGLAGYLRWGGPSHGGANGPLAPVGRLPLGQGKNVRLVQCGEEILLLAVTDDSISLLRSYSEDEFESQSLEGASAEEGTALGAEARAIAGAALGGGSQNGKVQSFSDALARLRE